MDFLKEFFEWLMKLGGVDRSTPAKEENIDPEKPKGPELSPAYLIALKEKGVKEIAGSLHNDRILQYHATAGGHSTDEIAWCSSFMNFCHLAANLSRTGSAAARSWAGISEDVTDNPRTSDILVFAKIGDDWRGHVTFYVGEDETYWYTFGGNEKDQVKSSRFLKSGGSYRLLSIRRVSK